MFYNLKYNFDFSIYIMSLWCNLIGLAPPFLKVEKVDLKVDMESKC